MIYALVYFSRVVNEENEEAPMRRSFSVEDLLDEVEKICYNASGTSKVRHIKLYICAFYRLYYMRFLALHNFV